MRQQIAFYGSTPAYRPVLELHGWGDLQPELNTLSKRGEWVKMGELIDDDMLNAFAVVAPLDQVAGRGAAAASADWSTASASTRPTRSSPRRGRTCWPGFH